jgi:hypothetical protein
MIGSAMGAYQPLMDTFGGMQSQTSSKSGLFGGGMGGMLGDAANWAAGQFSGDTSGMTNQQSAGMGGNWFDRNIGGPVSNAWGSVFGSGFVPPNTPPSGYGGMSSNQGNFPSNQPIGGLAGPSIPSFGMGSSPFGVGGQAYGSQMGSGFGSGWGSFSPGAGYNPGGVGMGLVAGGSEPDARPKTVL